MVIRTLDIGADKQVDYFQLPKEDNPAMGYRAIRICLTREDVFKTQLRALYRASAFGNIAIMFPMITSVWEVREIKRIAAEVPGGAEGGGHPLFRRGRAGHHDRDARGGDDQRPARAGGGLLQHRHQQI